MRTSPRGNSARDTASLPDSELAHVVWDCNGKLFADADAMIAATIDAFAELGLSPVTVERYRALHVQLIDTFYDHLSGRPLPSWLRQHTGFASADASRRFRPARPTANGSS